jgi:hypothetical protein
MLEFDTTVPLPAARTIEQIEGEIIILRDQVARNSIEIGRKLIEARNMDGEGPVAGVGGEQHPVFLPDGRAADAAAEKYGNVPALAGFEATKVYALMALPDDQVEDFVAGHDLGGMTSREVQAAVKAQKEAEARADQLALDLEDEEGEGRAGRRGGEKGRREGSRGQPADRPEGQAGGA